MPQGKREAPREYEVTFRTKKNRPASITTMIVKALSRKEAVAAVRAYWKEAYNANIYTPVVYMIRKEPEQ